MKHITIEELQRLDLIETALQDAKRRMPNSRLVADLDWLTKQLRQAWNKLESE